MNMNNNTSSSSSSNNNIHIYKDNHDNDDISPSYHLLLSSHIL